MKPLVVLAAFAGPALAAPAIASAQAPVMRGPMPAAPPPAYAQPYPAQPYPAPAPAYAPPCCAGPAQPYPAQAYPPAPYPAQPAYGYGPAPEPEYAGRGLRGYVGLGYQETGVNGTAPTPNVDAWTAEAALSGPLGRLDGQADIKAIRFEDATGDEEWVISPTLHLFRRTPGAAYGAFVGISNGPGATLYAGGLEAEAHMSAATFYGSVGFGRLNNGTDYDVAAAKIGGRYYFSEYFRIDGSVGYARYEAGGAIPDTDTVVAGIGAEYQLPGVPASLRVGYQWANPGGAAPKSETLRVGVRWALTGETLAQRDRHGPSFENIGEIFSRD